MVVSEQSWKNKNGEHETQYDLVTMMMILFIGKRSWMMTTMILLDEKKEFDEDEDDDKGRHVQKKLKGIILILINKI